MNEQNNKCNSQIFDNTTASHKAYSYIVSLISDSGELNTLWLPKISDGVYHISDEPEYRFLRIEGQNGQWFARCIQPAFFQRVSIQNYNRVQLEDEQYLNIEYEDRGYSLFVQKISNGNAMFKNYTVPSEAEISIGSKSSNDICYENKYVSKKHAQLIRTGHQWQIQDLGSDSGVFVNGQRVNSASLRLGDVLFIMGMRIIIGTDFISINNGDDRIGVNHRLLKDIVPAFSRGYLYYSGENLGEEADSNFNRAPRKRMELEEKTIEVEGPPMSMEKAQMPLMLRMGSSMVMSGPAALAGNYTMLLSSVLFPLLSSKFTDKQRQEYEQLRKTKYTEYLENRKKEIINACTEELRILNKKYPNLSTVSDQMQQKKRLWERRPGDDDFLQLRLGSGSRPLSAVISYPEKRFGLDEDPLEEQMYQLAEKQYLLKDAPILLSLVETTVCGLKGDGEQVIDYVLQLVMQTAVFHSYDEVKMVFFLNPEELRRFECIRYLPHAWNDLRSVRFVATSEAEAYRIGDYLKGQIQDDGTERELNEILRKRPYYLVFALDKKLLDSHEFFKETLQSSRNNGISIVVAGDELPKETQTIITLSDEQNNTCTALGANGGEDTHFAKDSCNSRQIETIMRMLANTSLKAVAQAQDMPKTLTFLEMYQCGRIEQLNPLQRWRENNPVTSLAAPVGVGADGSLFMLDLHEKRQGPHGLVAGMTGSGKSEFIITYILSMAVNYHPDEVAFVLIDYKGGGLASAFENPKTGMRLPHLVGTITNLDGASIQRSLMSIESELIRRQKVFSEVASTTNEGTMDIYAYQKLYRAGKVSEPMPHLFIVSDEFAELKQQQPEFMEKLISAARIGRSLGVHLILATQKPSGVVNDQIRSNTKFRVCLRVQDRSDSMDMLKRADAAELTDTGRFYLQVGYNEYFALGQSAWCGAAYEPQDKVIVQRDDAIEFLNITGEVIVKAKPKVKKTDSGVKQIVAIVQHLSSLAQNHGIHTRRLWIDPLSEILDVNDIPADAAGSNKDSVNAILGMIDDPEKQQQYPFVLNLQKCQNILIVGTSGCGKTTLLKTFIYSLVTCHSPDRVNLYIMDFSGGTLSVFRDMPHCGAFLTDSDESAIDRLMQMIRDLIKERKQIFNQFNVTSFDACRTVCDIPIIIVAIDNVSGMTELKNGNAYFSTLHEYFKTASAYGIKFVVTCNNLNEVSTRARQEINYRIALQLKDKYTYADVLGSRCDCTPASITGRGMCVCDGRMLEFQTAIPFSNSSEIERTPLIANQLATIVQNNKSLSTAKRIPVIDPEENYEMFCRDISTGRIPLGYDLCKIKPVSIPFAQLFSMAIYFGNERAAALIFENLIFAAVKNEMDLILVKRDSKSVLNENVASACKSINTRTFNVCKKTSLDLCYILMDEIKKRKVFRDEYCASNNIHAECAKKPETLKAASTYIRQNTKPLLIIFEDFFEFSCNLEEECFSIYKEIFNNGKGYNIYFCGGFYPQSNTKGANDLLTSAYVDSALLLLFGGQLQKQTFAMLPSEYRRSGWPEQKYNEFIMRYNGSFFPMVMPCSPLPEEILDPDEQPII